MNKALVTMISYNWLFLYRLYRWQCLGLYIVLNWERTFQQFKLVNSDGCMFAQMWEHSTILHFMLTVSTCLT